MKVSAQLLRTVLFSVSSLALLWGYRALLLDHAPAIFQDDLEDLSFGWYVPVMSLYVVWRERREILAAVGSPSPWGLVLSLPFFLAGFLGVRGSQIRLEIVGFVGLLIALCWGFWGVRLAKRILFPALFLLFCLPLHTYLDVVTIHLRMLAVSGAYGLLQGVGVDVVREGTMLLSPTGTFSIDVADPCSGMRSLFAMMAVTAGYAYFTQPSWFRRGLLFAASIPIVVLGNVFRIFSIAFTAATCSADFATGYYHDYSGYVVFLVSIALMVGVGGLVTRAFDRPVAEKGGEAASVAKPASRVSPTPLALAYSLFLAVATVAAMAFQAKTVNPVLCEAPPARLPEIAGYASQAHAPDEAELSALPADTRVDRCGYASEDGDWFLATVVVGGKSKSSIHRPELCLPSHGNQMSDPRTLTAGGRDWHCVTLSRGNGLPTGFAYTFFNQAGYRTSSHMRRIFRDVWDRSVLGRIDRWVMVTVASSTTDDRRMVEFLTKLGEELR